MSFDKFTWLKALQSDARFTDKEFRLATAVCTEFTRSDGTGWAVELAVLAKRVPGELSPHRTKALLKRLCDCGYLVETWRSSGGRGQVARRAHDLSHPPKPGTQASGVFGGETRYTSVTNLARQRTKPSTYAARRNGPELGEGGAKGTPTGTPGGARTRVRDETNPSNHPHPHPLRGPYGPRCAEHLDDPDPPSCTGCKRQRLSAEARDRADADAHQARLQAIRADIAACDQCDRNGWIHGDDSMRCRLHRNLDELVAPS